MADTTTTTTFRFPPTFHGLLDRYTAKVGATRAEVVQRSVELTAALLNEASRAQYADLDKLRQRCRDDASLELSVFQNKDGSPDVRVLVDGEQVDFVEAYARVDEAAGEAHIFLEVPGSHTARPRYAQIGSETLFVTRPRMPVGKLPWPPKPMAIQIRLADIEQAAAQAEQASEDLIQV